MSDNNGKNLQMFDMKQKLADLSKRELIRQHITLLGQLNHKEHVMRILSISYQCTMCALRELDKDHVMFQPESGMFNQKQIDLADKYIASGEYTKYLVDMKERYGKSGPEVENGKA